MNGMERMGHLKPLRQIQTEKEPIEKFSLKWTHQYGSTVHMWIISLSSGRCFRRFCCKSTIYLFVDAFTVPAQCPHTPTRPTSKLFNQINAFRRLLTLLMCPCLRAPAYASECVYEKERASKSSRRQSESCAFATAVCLYWIGRLADDVTVEIVSRD